MHFSTHVVPESTARKGRKQAAAYTPILLTNDHHKHPKPFTLVPITGQRGKTRNGTRGCSKEKKDFQFPH